MKAQKHQKPRRPLIQSGLSGLFPVNDAVKVKHHGSEWRFKGTYNRTHVWNAEISSF